MKLYQHQTEMLDDLRAGWAEATRQLLVSPTGSGKTVMFSHLAAEFVKAGARVLILVDQNNLIDQTLEKLHACTGISGQIEQADNRASHNAQVVVGSVQTIYRPTRIERWPKDHFGLIIADEADKSVAMSWQAVLNHFDSTAKVVGFTATPHRTDQRNLGEYYQRKVEKENLKSLIKKGFLANIRIERLPIKIDLSSVHMKQTAYGSDFNEAELDEVITPHLEAIARAIQDRAAFRKTVVFLPLVKTAVKFAEICNGIGLPANHISGEDPDRVEKWEAYKRRDFEVMANAMLLTRGVDDPEISCVVPCRPTKSRTLYFQAVGRGTRLHPLKSELLLLDFLFQSSHLICRPYDLIATDDLDRDLMVKVEEEREAVGGMIEQLDLLEVAADASSQREDALRKRLKELENRKAQLISSEQFAADHQSVELADYDPAMANDRHPVSDNQMKWLEKVRVGADGMIFLHGAPKGAKPLDLTTVTNFGQASKILEIAFDKKWRGVLMASDGQKSIMRRMGAENWATATAHEARTFFAQIKQRRKQREMSL